MTIRCLILLLILGNLSLEGLSQGNTDDNLRQIISLEGQVQVRIPNSGKKDIDFITRNVSILSLNSREINISLSSRTVEWFINQSFDYQIIERPSVKDLHSASGLKGAMEWDSYPTYDQYVAIMQGFVTTYPSLCRLETIGTSKYGKQVLALKISDNAGADEDEPEVFYSSTMHGDETAGFVLLLHLADYLLKNYSVSSQVKNLTDNLEIWINPLANPDGTYRTGNTIVSPVRYNAENYDLNRNFPDPFTPYNQSTNIKQPETIDMMNFMGDHRFVLSANFHSGAEVVNYPWDRWLSKIHADDNWFFDISREYADTVHKYSGPAYMNDENNGITRGAEWYVVYGGRQDYITWELQGREVTIELDDIFVTPGAQLPLLWEYNYRSLLGYLENALSGIHGKVLDAGSLVPVPAKIFIAGHDKDSSHIYSDTLTGSYVRMLAPGSYNITFSAKGYVDTIVNNVIVIKDQRTDLTVKMKSGLSSIDSTVPAIPVLYPIPASGRLKAILADRMAGQVNIRIYNRMGQIIAEYDDDYQLYTPIEIDINGFSPGLYSIIFRHKKTGISQKCRFVVI
jgi:hypothetical protein